MTIEDVYGYQYPVIKSKTPNLESKYYTWDCFSKVINNDVVDFYCIRRHNRNYLYFNRGSQWYKVKMVNKDGEIFFNHFDNLFKPVSMFFIAQ